MLEDHAAVRALELTYDNESGPGNKLRDQTAYEMDLFLALCEMPPASGVRSEVLGDVLRHRETYVRASGLVLVVKVVSRPLQILCLV